MGPPEVDLTPALLGVVCGALFTVALFQVALLRIAVLIVTVGAITLLYLHGGVPALIAGAHHLLRILEGERHFWAGVLGGKLLAGLLLPLWRTRG